MTAPGTPTGSEGSAAPEGHLVASAQETVEQVIRRRISDALGGWYGSLETALPTVAFVATWLITDAVRPAVIAAAGLLVVLTVVRGFVGGSWRFIGSAVFATAIAAFFALRSGEAQDAFLPGIVVSGAYGVAALVSILARWPLVGFIVAVGDPDFAERPTAWRRDAGLVAVCSRLTWVLVGLFALRVAVMLPLYLAGEVAWLGVTKIALSWPAYLVAVLIMGAMLATGRTPSENAAVDR
ncbi:DUF3159 domain-containing protein [Serinicoccus profundi]|uniref:DUF3159 domain-containing protein n=1 Tax=Serinicoccus profundi TaxID=1078471 RepID=UPI000255F7F2|nr:DUF3159 domain-containing protein [Serinicoccus profundi]